MKINETDSGGTLPTYRASATSQETAFNRIQLISLPIEVPMMHCYPEGFFGETVENIWKDERSDLKMKMKSLGKTNRNNCRKKLEFKQLLRIFKNALGNLKNLLRCSPKSNETNQNCRKHDSIGSAHILVQSMATLLEIEERLGRLYCAKNEKSYITRLMKKVRKDILYQLNSGDYNCVELNKSIQDVAYIQCLVEELERKKCNTTGGLAVRSVVVNNIDKSVNTDNPCVKTEDKSTNYEQCNVTTNNEKIICPKKMLYTYRIQNGTKKTEFEKRKLNSKYYYDVCQVNKCTNISLPNENLVRKKKECYCQTDTVNKSSLEITTVTVSYKHEIEKNTLESLPRITDVTKDYIMYFNEENLANNNCRTGIKCYNTKIDRGSYYAQTNTGINSQELTIIYNNDPRKSQSIDENNLSNIDLNLQGLTKEIINQLKQIAAQVLYDFLSKRNQKEFT